VSESPVTYEVVDGVAWITINRPEARNALNKVTRDGLFENVRRFNDDDSAKVSPPPPALTRRRRASGSTSAAG